MSNNITAYFKGRMGVTEALYQNDYGIIMNFDGISLPAHFDCYFSIDGEDEAVPAVGSDDMVQIPNACLAHAGKIELHIPLHSGENDSEVEYVVYTKVIGRARPVDDGTPVQMTAIEQALALLQNPIGNIEQIVNEALSFTGETFAEMQEQLDADQAAFQSDMGDRADAFEAQIQSDISDVESDFDNLNAQYQTAVAAHTVDSEVQNVRVGADNVTYASAGEAVRTQVTNLKNDLEAEQDEGLFHRYLTWEHGGIDNATGANNNEGSLVRSRMPEYLRCADYIQILNESHTYAWVIYYNEEYGFNSAYGILPNETHTILERAGLVYFRLDLRGKIDLTGKIKAYQKHATAMLKDAIQEEIATQIYFYNNRAFIEEDPTNKKVFFSAPSAPFGLFVRYGKDGTAKVIKSLHMSDLAGELNVSLVTSTRGITNCIAINDEHALVYDTSSNTFAIVHRNSVTSNHVPVIVQNGGYITYAHSSVSAFLQPNRANTYAQVYFRFDEGDIEEDVNDKKVYLHAKHNISLRYGENGGGLIEKDTTMANLATELGVSLVTSPNGIADCIAIDDEYALVYDISAQKYVLVHRYNLTNNQIPLIVQNGGFITYASPYFLKKLKGNTPTLDVVIPDYWYSAIAEAELSINNFLAADENSASFGFVTDTHVGNNKGYSGALLKKVMSDCHIPVWFHGGDAVTGTGVITKANLINEMKADFEQFVEIESIGLRAIGNHESAFGVNSNYDSNLTNAELNHYYHGIDREKFLQVYGTEKGYFYKDIHKDKLRCICLDIIPYESQVDSNDLVTESNKMWYHQFGSEQLEWFANVLQNTPENYNVVVCSHIAPVSLSELKSLDDNWSESVPIDYLQARKIAEAYALKTTYTFSGTISGDTTGDSYNINVDFSSAHGEFVCFFCGHTHKDFMLKLNNVNIVGTANDSFAVSTNAPSYAPSKTANTATEQIMDFFCIMPSTRTVRVVRLGAYLEANGKVRTFTY